MSSNSGSNLYSQGYGTTSSSSFPGNAIIQNRPPSTGDIKGPAGMYSLGQLWVDESTQSSWQLISFSSSQGSVTANWSVLGGSSSDVNTLSGQTGTATPSGGNIEISGSGPLSTSAAGDTVTIAFTPGTLAVATLTGNSGGPVSPTTGNINVLGSGALAFAGTSSTLTGTITPGSLLVAALHPDSGGDVSPASGVINVTGGAGVTTTGSGNTLTIGLTGGGVAIDSVGTQTGTNPITPSGTGLITINGAVVAAGSNPVRSDGTGANTMAIEVQTSQAVASTDATKIGLSAFDSGSFTVDANGFVTLKGGTEAIDSLIPNSGTSPVFPALDGSITFQGTGSLTTVGGTNSITPQLTGLTDHNVLVGAGTPTITNVAPGTAGIPLVSTGAAADPSFTTALVVGGGTGSVSFNTYGPVVAGATSTTALTSVSPSSTAGIPLVSNGSSSNPSFTTAVVAGGGTGSTAFNIYGPVVAAATATGALTSVSPSVTAGVPLISQGSAATPAFGTVVVAGGGTGVTSLAAYSPIVGGATTTSAVQSASSGQATSGFVLTSTGASSVPTWQATNDTAAVKTITGNSGGAESPDGSGNFNFVGSGSIATQGTTNTETISLTGLTNHNVLVGAGTDTITKVPPSSTLGIPLISQGVSADPSFGTALVAGGGTASTSFTANGVVISNTSSTGALTALNVTNGQLIIGSTMGAPAAANLTQGTGITITNGANSITIAADGAASISTITGNSGGPESPLAGNFNILGTGSISVVGTANTETIGLTGLTNHALLVGAGTGTITSVGPSATSGQILQSAGSSADPAFSTATYPSSTTANQILYSSATNTVGQITTAANGVLITDNSSVPSLLANSGTAGYVLTANSGAPPSWQVVALPPAVDSNTATAAFGTLVAATPKQNTLGYEVLITGTVSVTASTAATLTLGVGPSATPSVDPLTDSFTVAAFTPIAFSAIVPDNYYILLDSTGVITIGAVTVVVTPL